ncbi:DMT family transporter [Paraburkholderia sp. MM5482-R1]|uniref:DMT family transporter n=1 Tax=unclassified Paraburkholderia TaxID=2615204 RepID=UPI003D229DEA
MNPDTRQHLRANVLMLIAAMIWGSAFVAQRLSLDTIGPFLFTGLRFLLGALVVLTMIVCVRRAALAELTKRAPGGARELLGAGGLLGVVLAVSISLQQIGLYVVIVPLLGVLLRHRTGLRTWLGALLAAVGMYFLSVDEHFSMLYGDWYQLAGALVISAQMMLVGRFAARHDTLMLALAQFVTCGLVCLSIGLAIEPVSAAVIARAAPTIAYGGALSVGVAYTIQVVAQRYAAPSHAAVIFSMEGVFAAFAGWLVLGETLTTRALFGSALMLAGLIVCQILPGWKRARQRAPQVM